MTEFEFLDAEVRSKERAERESKYQDEINKLRARSVTLMRENFELNEKIRRVRNMLPLPKDIPRLLRDDKPSVFRTFAELDAIVADRAEVF